LAFLLYRAIATIGIDFMEWQCLWFANYTALLLHKINAYGCLHKTNAYGCLNRNLLLTPTAQQPKNYFWGIISPKKIFDDFFLFILSYLVEFFGNFWDTWPS
jgi:hypothetical protein